MISFIGIVAMVAGAYIAAAGPENIRVCGCYIHICGLALLAVRSNRSSTPTSG